MWRKIYQVDTILEDFQCRKFFADCVEPQQIGLDKDGDLVKYSPTGRTDVTEIFKCVKMNNYMKHWAWFAEKNVASVKEEEQSTGKMARITLIMDLDKLEFANATSKLAASSFLRFTYLYQDNYPERMKSTYVINAPAYYVMIFRLLQTVMSQSMLKKIHVFGSKGWKEKLLEAIDADVLPAFLGGNRKDPDGNPLCKTFISFPSRTFENYYLSNEERYFRDSTEVQEISIPAKETEEVEVYVAEAITLIEWKFLVKSKDIDFGLFFQKSDEERTEIIPVHRIDTTDGTEEDSHKCQHAGKYILLFDNSYSWFSTKRVQYCISLQEPVLGP